MNNISSNRLIAELPEVLQHSMMPFALSVWAYIVDAAASKKYYDPPVLKCCRDIHAPRSDYLGGDWVKLPWAGVLPIWGIVSPSCPLL